MSARLLKAGLVALLIALPTVVHAAATIVIVNRDGPNEGFNDPTPAAPVGGNTGTTIGAQRLIAVQAAANLWGVQLDSSVDIFVRASFDSLSCTATTAVLGHAGAVSIFRDFAGAPLAGHWYPAALANKLAGLDLLTPAQDPLNFHEVFASFNSGLGQAGCLAGSFFYYGLDNNHGASVDLVTVVLHELAHGLGFQTFTDHTTGQFLSGTPSAFDHYILDTTSNKLWDQMTVEERVVSALTPRKVVWNGGLTTSLAPLVLQSGTPEMRVNSPSNVADTYLVGTATFGPPLAGAGVTGDLMPIVDASAAGPGCNPLTGANVLAVSNNIALIDRGTCAFATKVKNAQNAGAKGVVIANNVAGSPPGGMGGVDPTITIPSVLISLEDANRLKDQLRFRSRTRSGVNTKLFLNLAVLAGADPANRVLLYTPNPWSEFAVTHWDFSVTPSLLMEPPINPDLSHSVTFPLDLTLQALWDLGW